MERQRHDELVRGRVQRIRLALPGLDKAAPAIERARRRIVLVHLEQHAGSIAAARPVDDSIEECVGHGSTATAPGRRDVHRASHTSSEPEVSGKPTMVPTKGPSPSAATNWAESPASLPR